MLQSCAEDGKLTEKFGIQLKIVDVGGEVSYLTHSPAANT